MRSKNTFFHKNIPFVEIKGDWMIDQIPFIVRLFGHNVHLNDEIIFPIFQRIGKGIPIALFPLGLRS